MHISTWVPLALVITLATAASTSVRKGGRFVESSFGFPDSSGSTTFFESVSGSDYSTAFTSSQDSVSSTDVNTLSGGESTSTGFISDSSTTTSGRGTTATVGTGSTPTGTGTRVETGTGTGTVTATTPQESGGPAGDAPDTNNTGAAPGRVRMSAGVTALVGVTVVLFSALM